jgi:hypothetical protein
MNNFSTSKPYRNQWDEDRHIWRDRYRRRMIDQDTVQIIKDEQMSDKPAKRVYEFTLKMHIEVTDPRDIESLDEYEGDFRDIGEGIGPFWDKTKEWLDAHNPHRDVPDAKMYYWRLDEVTQDYQEDKE